ncbi:MAG: alpha-amylase family glycosyl hydrolase [Actinomycetota bacterium]
MATEPRATYRLQLHRDFGFVDLADIVDYLAELGIDHLYCSPYLQARSGSHHGYDVVDHSKVGDELGGRDRYETMLAAFEAQKMRHIIDLVPNHMAISERANSWWWDVLKNGPNSRFASYFDIEWDPTEAKLRRKVLLPILDDHYGRGDVLTSL